MLTLLFAALFVLIICCNDKAWSCKGLTEDMTKTRWLSAPNSRIVLNHAEVCNQPAERPVSESLALRLAYFVGDNPARMPMLWSLDPDVFKPVSLTWAPHRIVSQIASDTQKAGIESVTCLTDADTISQLYKINELESDSLVIKGRFDDGKIAWDEKTGTINLTGSNFNIAISFSTPVQWIGEESGAWSVRIDGVKAGDEIVISGRFSLQADANNAPLNAKSFYKAVQKREAEWDAILEKVPHPMDFKLHILNREISSEDIERTYYRAWVFVMSDILPPMPENDYHYPQLACGKPSLWNEGHPKALPSAQWESFLAMQFAALVDPDTAWAAFEGMMTLVDEQGSMGGEGLPSRHTQTAWMLYSLTGNTEGLRTTYASLKRMLLWKALDPRWIYHGATRENSKDSEFVAHALLDMVYATKIAEVLNMPEEKVFWQEQIDKLSASFKEWFWETKGGFPFEFYFADIDFRDAGRTTWCLQALVLPLDILGEAQRDSLMRTYRFYINDEMTFLIHHLTKHPTYNFTMRGVWQYGTPEEVAKMAEAAMSAVTNAGEFAEEYGDWFPAACSGVTPSIFGAANILDACLWHNGIILGDGLPIVAHVPNAKGVTNLMIRGKRLNVCFDGDSVKLDGSALEVLNTPTECTLGVGEQMVLELS